MKKLLLIIPASLLVLSACSTKSYTYEVSYGVEGSEPAEVTVKYPSVDHGNGGVKKDASITETIKPGEKKVFIAEGLGPVSVEVKSGANCVLTVEKEPEIKKQGKCEYTITEDTDN